MKIIEPEILDENKPSCVVGVLTTENGKVIADELYEMLNPKYNVYKVEQEPPGREFEYPAINFAIDLCKTKKLKQVLYLHTKGAVYSRPIAKQVRQGLWKQEFVDNIDWYLTTCDTDKPTVACPATNNSGTTWYNGFFINLPACEIVTLKKELCNRYYYEHIFCQPVNKNIKVVGRLFNDVAEGINTPSHKKLNDYILNLPIVSDVRNVNNIVSTDTVKNKRVIYTCITGGYEAIMPLTHRQPGFDYICFTDNSGQTSSFWQLRPIPDELLNLSSVKQQRIIKICPHRYLSEYDESIWIDGAIDVLSNPNNFIERYCSDKNKSVFIRRHPCRDCIYEEASACIRLKKDTSTNINPQLDKYREEGFPKHFGLVESNIIYRRHNNPYCVKLMELWANELISGSHRDQLSFNYALWKAGNDGFKYLDMRLTHSPYFKWYTSHNRGRVAATSSEKKNQQSAVPRCNTSLGVKKDKNKKTVQVKKHVPAQKIVTAQAQNKKNKPVNVITPKNDNVIEFKKSHVILKQNTRVLSRIVDNISEKKMKRANKRNSSSRNSFFR